MTADLVAALGAKICQLERRAEQAEMLASIRFNKLVMYEQEAEQCNLLRAQLAETESVLANVVAENKELRLENSQVEALKESCLRERKNAKIFENMKEQTIIPLAGLGALKTELEFITEKNLAEFVSIYSVKELPRIQMEILAISAVQREVLYSQVPRAVVKELFFAEATPARVNSIWDYFGPKSIHEGYTLMESHTQQELHIRIQEMLAPYWSDVPTDNQIKLLIGNEAFSLTLPGEAEFYFSIKSIFPTFTPYQEANIYGFEDGNFECMICCDAHVNTVLLDCCHASTCEACTNSFRDGKCPICRAVFSLKVVLPVKPRPSSNVSRPGSVARTSPRTSLL